MNQRIKELMGKTLDDKFSHTWDTMTHEGLLMFSEKFAELIVRDCASICEINGQSYTHSFTPAKARLAESTSNHCGLMIKRHFGVKE